MPNLKIGIEEHDFLRKIITEKYQQKEPTWSSGGNLNNYNNIARTIRQNVKGINDSLSVSPHQMQKLFMYHGECIYREDFIEACYLYCSLIRDAHAFMVMDGKGVTSAEGDVVVLQQEVEYLKNLLQESENRAETLQKKVDHYAEQNSEFEEMLETLKIEMEEKKDYIQILSLKTIAQNEQNESLHRKITAQKEQNESLNQEIAAQYEQHELLKDDLGTQQNQLRALESRFIEQAKAVHHYVGLLKSYKALIEHQKAVSDGELQNLKQIIVTLNDENQRLAMEKTFAKKSKKTFAKILSII